MSSDRPSFAQAILEEHWATRPHHPFEGSWGGIRMGCGCVKIDHAVGASPYKVGDVQPRAVYEGGCQRRFGKHRHEEAPPVS